mmetsp:Transcript_53043/g.158743  ORF Transcript_53043/g.158743 Transcript_53043/m.158743 type:complete len:361 (-) Transcript_53043:120-1202(-)
MWGGMSGGPPPPPSGGQFRHGDQQKGQQQKHDIFVGNLAFSTTEEQLHQAFSEIGKIIKVRMVTDLETGKPRGFAFIEFEDPQAALSAIRNMNDYELNGRRIRVNFSNSSHLETLAGKLGMDMSQHTQQRSGGAGKSGDGGSGTQAVAESLKGMSKGEMYDVVAKLKDIAEKDPDEARRLLCGHPQLPEAILHLMSKLDMIKTPLSTTGGVMDATGAMPAPIAEPPKPVAAPPSDPRMRAADPRASAGMPADPRSVRVDPRAAARAQHPPPMSVPPPPPGGMNVPPPPAGMPPMGAPPPPPNFSVPPPGMPPPPQPSAVAGLDPSLVQQVMSLTPQQISQLPPDKQQSILALRQQITGGR